MFCERICVKQRVSTGPVVNNVQAVRTWLQDYSGNNVSCLAVQFLRLWQLKCQCCFVLCCLSAYPLRCLIEPLAILKNPRIPLLSALKGVKLIEPGVI